MRSLMRLLATTAVLVVAAAAPACGGEAEPLNAVPTPAPAPVLATCRNIEVEAADGRRKVCSNGCAIRFRESPEKFGAK
jgi:hypothetical protein